MQEFTLLERLSDPVLIESMSLGEKLSAGLVVAILGMGITFLALLLLWFCITMLGKLAGATVKKVAPTVKEADIKPSPTVENIQETEDTALIAVIAAAIAASENTSIHNILVTKVRRVEDNKPSWARAGIQSQIGSRL